MALLAQQLSSQLHPGDCYCLYGEVGAGKSAFSRAFIRAASQDDTMPVTSPTYLLQNIYDEHGDPPIHHFDLYRLVPAGSSSGASSGISEKDMQRLSLEESFREAVSLVEWAERIQGQEPAERLAVHISVLDTKAGEGDTHADAPGTSGSHAGGDTHVHHASSGMHGESTSQGASSSHSSVESGAGGAAAESPDDAWEDEEEDEYAEDEDAADPYTDRRWRLVQLQAHGPWWNERLAELRAHVQREGAAHGLVVLE